MLTNDVIYTFILICQICIGVMANSLLFIIYTYTFLTEPHLKKPIDSIFMHLTVVNISTIMIPSIPELMSSFGIKDFFDDIGCQTFLYVSRVIRGLSICTTFLLSVCQAITISPSHSKWARLKSKLSAWIFPSLLFFWVINMLIYTLILKTVKARLNFTVVGQGYVNAYCQSRKPIAHEARSFISIIVIHDVVFLALMIWSSLYMVWILYRHRRRAQHIHTSSLSSKTSPENKATHTILWMVFCFVFFYVSNNCLTLYGYYASEKNSRLEGIGGILSSCYPTFCPFFLMKHNKIILKLTSILSNMRMTFCPRAFSG